MAETGSPDGAWGQPSAPSGKPPRDGWVVLGLAVSAVSAAVSSFGGLKALAEVTGWSPVMAPLLPLCVDSLAVTSMRVWVSTATRSTRARRLARNTAVGAILLSLAGNALYHVIAAGLLPVSWVVVLSVGAVPALVLGLTSHLAVLRTQADVPEPPAKTARGRTASAMGPGTAGPPRDRRAGGGRPGLSRIRRPRYGSEADLLVAAREADWAYREAHNGRPISRDELQRVLRVSTGRASGLVRELRAAEAANHGSLVS